MPKNWLANKKTQLRLEPLEARRLLAGLQVSVFIDQDGSRAYDAASDTLASDRLVFIDLNEDGSHDLGEPIQVTSDDGTAFFEGLEVGEYSLGILANPEIQRQASSVRVAPTAEQINAPESSALLTSPFLSEVWSVDSNGYANDLNSPGVSVDLGGSVLASVSADNLAYLVVDRRDADEISLVEFDLLTGDFYSTDILGLDSQESVRGVVATSDASWVILESASGFTIGKVGWGESESEIADRMSLGSSVTAIAPSSTKLASVVSSSNGRSVVGIVDLANALDASVEYELDGEIAELTFSADGSRLYAAKSGGGVVVLALTDEGLQLEAILADANAPVAANSRDARVFTGSSASGNEVITWDSSSWTRVGNTVLGEGSSITGLVTDVFGDNAIASSDAGVFSLNLAVAESPVVAISSSNVVAQTMIGVRMKGTNSAPDVSGVEERTLQEDIADEIDFSTSGLQDFDGDQLWFTVVTPPSSGTLTVDDHGNWSYLPSQDFSGEDSAVLNVHDGVATSELTLHWDVTPVNDPPLDVHLQIPTLPENSAPGETVGFVSIVDPDQFANYRITTSDPRFEVVNGEIFFVGGELDFDTESDIHFEIQAVDVEDPEHQISASATLPLIDVNEPPTALEFSASQFFENEDGVQVGTLTVLDPDATQDYQYEVSDERFEVRDGVIRLLPGNSINYEEEQTVSVTVTATDSQNPENEISEVVTLDVSNSNEPPADLLLSRRAMPGDTPGAVVGELTVTDEDGDAYLFAVSDSRFEVVDKTLRLRATESIPFVAASSLSLVVTATAGGDAITRTFPIVINPPRSSHQNTANPADVNGDGVVTPIDALIIVNELNSGGGGPLPTDGDGEDSGMSMDVSGDGVLSPMDVLIIINELNNQARNGSGEGEGVEAYDAYGPQQPQIPTEDERRQNLELDAELEALLTELSLHRNS